MKDFGEEGIRKWNNGGKGFSLAVLKQKNAVMCENALYNNDDSSDDNYDKRSLTNNSVFVRDITPEEGAKIKDLIYNEGYQFDYDFSSKKTIESLLK